MYVIQVDAGHRLLDITTSGFWELPEAASYADELRVYARQLRQSSGRLRAIVNALDSPVQSAAVMAVISEVWNDVLTDKNDRVALMVESSLAKLQAKRLFTSDNWQAFLSPTAAKTWLSV
jgi:hypothetical protein